MQFLKGWRQLTESDTFCVEMPSQMRTPSKRAGGRVGDAFRRKLEELIASVGGSQRAFARKLWEDVSAKVDRSPRVGEWRRGRNLPKADSLQLIARKFDVSTDWLLGFPVPKRRTDRELVSHLGRSLVDYVVSDYIQRATRERRDGLAHAMGGRLVDADSPEPLKRGDPWPPIPKVGDVLPDGRVLLHLGILTVRALDVDPLSFLQRVCERVFQDAEQWEEDHTEDERKTVRDDIRALAPMAAEIAAAEQAATGRPTTEAIVFESLLSAALEPLNARNQTHLIMYKQHLLAHRAKQERKKRRQDDWENDLRELLASGEILAALPDDLPTNPTRERKAPRAPTRRKSGRIDTKGRNRPA